MKINYNFLGIIVCVMYSFNVIMVFYDYLYAKISAVVYSIGLIIIYFIVVNCDMKWKKRKE